MTPDAADGPDDPPGDEDAALLAAVRSMWEAADPVPTGLVERVRFGVDLDDLDVELMALVEVSQLAAARSDLRTRLVTFQSDSMAVMLTIEQCADGTARIDGWLTPGGCHHVELRCPDGPRSTDTDDGGRFSLDAVPAGTARLIVYDTGTTRRIVTPTVEI